MKKFVSLGFYVPLEIFFLETALLPVKDFLVRFSPFMHIVGNVLKTTLIYKIFSSVLSIYSYFFHDQFFFLTSEKNDWVQPLSTSSTYIDECSLILSFYVEKLRDQYVRCRSAYSLKSNKIYLFQRVFFFVLTLVHCFFFQFFFLTSSKYM